MRARRRCASPTCSLISATLPIRALRTNSQKQSVPIFAQGFEADQPFGRLDRLIAVAERIGLFGALLKYAYRNGVEAAALRHPPTGKRLGRGSIAAGTNLDHVP